MYACIYCDPDFSCTRTDGHSTRGSTRGPRGPKKWPKAGLTHAKIFALRIYTFFVAKSTSAQVEGVVVGDYADFGNAEL